MDDRLSEKAEKFRVTLEVDTAALRGNLTLPNPSAITEIAESDPIRVDLVGPLAVNEGGIATYHVLLSSSGGIPSSELGVDYATKDVSATAGDDYVAKSGALIFAPTDHGPKQVQVSILSDDVDEDDEAFDFAISDPMGGGGPTPALGNASVSTTITSGEITVPSIALSTRPSSISEDPPETPESLGEKKLPDHGELVTVKAVLDADQPFPWDTEVTLSFAGTASDPHDYSVITSKTVTIPANSLSGTGELFITAVDNPVLDGARTIDVEGSAVGISSVSPATVTIVDDDKATVTLTSSATVVNEGSSVRFDARLSHAVGAEVTVGWRATGPDAGDFSPASGSVTFPADSGPGAVRSFTIDIKDDDLSETTEVLTVKLGNLSVDGPSRTRSNVVVNPSAASAVIPSNDAIVVSVSAPEDDEGQPLDPVVEGDTTGTYTVTLSKIPTADLTVDLATVDDSALAADDYTAKSETLTFSAAAKETTKTLTLATTEDDLTEGTESFDLVLSSPQGGGGPAPTLDAADSSLEVEIDDDDFAVLSIQTVVGQVEEGGAAQFRVILSKQVNADVTVGWSAGDDPGADRSPDSGAVTFPANSAAGATRTITVNIADDALTEPAETFTVKLGGIVTDLQSMVSVHSGSGSADATIAESDPVTVGLSGPTQVLVNGQAEYRVSLDRFPAADLTVSYGTSNGTASAGVDYTATSGVLTFAAGETAKTVAVPVLAPGAGKTFNFGILSPGGGGGPTPQLGTPSDITTTIVAANATPVNRNLFRLSAAPNRVTESDGATTVTVTATLDENQSLDRDVEIQIGAHGGGTAEEGVDYTFSPIAGSAITVGTGKTSGSVNYTLTPIDDGQEEDPETIVVRGASSDDLQIVDAAITITDPAPVSSETTSAITLSASPDTVREDAASAVDVTVTATLEEGVTLETDVTVTISLGGTASSSDYAASALASVTIQAGQGSGSGTLRVTPIDNAVAEGDKTLVVNGAAAGFDVTGATITISNDDDAPSSISLSVGPDSLDEGDSATGVTVTATLDGDTTLPSVTAVTIGLGGTAGSSDYGVSSLASVSIPAGESSGTGTLTVTPTDDEVVEGDETITVGGSASGFTVSGATITLSDDDATELSISGPSGNVAEGSNATYTVTLSKAVAKQVKVAWSATAGTAEDADFSPASDSVTFAAGSAAGATRSFDVAVADDNLSEGTETFTVALGAITSDVSSQVSVKSGSGSVTTTIAESDPITVSLSGPSTVTEGDTTTSYTVSLSPSGVTPTADLTVAYATSAGSATAGSDYTSKSGTLTFTPSDAADKTVAVATVEDSLDESGETFTLATSSPQGGGGPAPSLSSTAKSVTTTITDDDDTPTGITLSVDPASLDEGDSATGVTVTATLDGDSTLTSATAVTIGLGGTAGSSDYGVSSLASVSIPAGEASGSGTLTVTPTDDAVVEGDETIVVSGSVTGFTVTPATITLEDDDTAELSVSGPSGVAEGSDATYTVTLSKEAAAQVKVVWSITAGTAAAGDYTATPATLTFGAGSAAGATRTFTVAVTDDDLSETSETFGVALGSVSGDLAGRVSVKSGGGSVTTTIAESDPITVSLSGPSSVTEGDTTSSYTVSLSPSGVTPTADLTVAYATSAGSATAGSDYTSKSGTLTFTPSDAADKTVAVATVEDSLDESGETFTLATSSPQGGGGPAPSLSSTAKSVTTTITDDDDTPTGITLSVDPASLDEGDSATGVTVTATLDGDSTLTSVTTVTISLGGTAGSSDYGASALASVTIPAGQSSGSGTLTVTPTDDAVVEGDETITVGGSAPGFTVSEATITLEDDDTAELSVSGPSDSVAEGTDASYTVTLSKAVAKQVRVSWSATAGTAKAADFSPASGSVTFAAGSAVGATQSFDVAVADDDLSETAETFTVALGTVSGDLSDLVSVKSGSGSVTTTIAESDPITISLSGPSSVAEGDTTTSYTVSLSPSGVTPTADLTVRYATTAGTAVAGLDYKPAAGTFTFTASDTADKTITVSTAEDTLDESGETFTFAISDAKGGGGPAPSLSSTAKSVTTTITDDDGTPSSITLSVDPSSLGEGDKATQVTVTATLDGDSTLTSATTVTVSLGGTAGSADYRASKLASIKIPAGLASASGKLTVTPKDDAVVEGDETITVGGSATGFTVTPATITLEDDDTAEVYITGPSSSVTEGNNATYMATLSKVVAKQVRVAWSAAAGTAEAADFSPASGSVTFAADSPAGSSETFTVTATDDDLSEASETFTVALGTVSGDLSDLVSVKSGSGSATTTIAASDPITISLSGPSTVTEGDTTTSYTVSLSPSGVTPTADLTVAYATLDGSATAGDDYTSKSGKLTFTASDTADKTVTVSTVEDTLDESGETFTLAISNPQGGGGPAPSLSSTAKSVTTSIADDDGTPSSITLSVDPDSLDEGDSDTGVTVTATLDGSSTLTSATTVTVSLGGTAVSSDYGVSSLASVSIPAGQASGSGTLTVTPTDDAVVEGDETIVVSGAVTGFTVSGATITLEDDDTAEVSISGPTGNVAEGSNATYTVTLSSAVAKQVKVAWSVTLGTAEAADFSPASGSVTFPAGSAAGATQSFNVAIADDDLSEGSETFTVKLGTITSDVSSQVSVKSGSGSVTSTIAASDPITISLSGPSTVTEGDTTTSYTVSLSPSGVTPTADLTVDYATADGSATAGDDYTSKSGTVTFTQSGAGPQTVTVATIEDTLDESGETFTLGISNPQGGGGPAPSLKSTAKSVTTTIGDDDATPSSITLSVDPDSLGEGDSATDVTVTATLDGDSTLTSGTTVTVSLGGTAGSSDYGVSALASVSIPAGQASGSGTLRVTPTDDAVVEGDETITVGGSATGLTVSGATITLEDDDTAELSISGPSSNVAEGSSASYTVTLSKAVAKQVKVAWSVTLGTAEAADFSPASGTVTFAAGSAAGATKSFDVAVADDDLSEGTETFTVTLGTITSDVASDVSVKSGSGSAATTIAESDPITISLSGPSDVDEGDTTTSYTVSLSPSGVTPTADLTIAYATAAGTAAAGEDYTTKSGTITFTQSDRADKTVTVATVEDTLDESGETFTFAISNPQGGGGPAPSLKSTAKSVTTTITDDDATPTGITLSVDPASLDEGDSATGVTVTATLDGDSTLTSATNVTISLGGTASSSDYGVSSLASVTIPAGQSSGSGTLTVTPKDDTVVEGDETIVLSGSATGFTVTGATVTLEDDDTAELSISGPTGNVAEGNNATYTVTLSKAVAKQVKVAWTVTAGTASSSDYTATPSTLTFAAGSAAGATETFTVAVTDDDLSETSETFTAALGTITSDISSEVSVKSASASATTTIAASDPITVSLTGPSSVTEGDMTTSYTVSLSPSGVTPTADLTVDYATAAGTATAGDDYTTKSGTLTFTQSEAGAQTVTVATVEDSLDESGETFTLAISDPKGGGGPAASLSSTAKSVTTTIGDDDATPSSITLSVDPASLGEGDSATGVTVTATLDGDSRLTSATTVTVSLGGTAVSSDYGVSSLASVSIPAGQASGSGTLTVTPKDDAVVEGDETITVGGSATGLTVSGATITLEDDDTAQLSISGPSSNVAEGSNATYTVTLSKAIAKQVKVAWSATAGTASSSDYTAASSTLTFSAGSAAGSTRTFTVAVTDDDLSEGTETFTVALGTITSDVSSQVSVKSGSGSVTTTIAASDPITVSLSGPTTVDEGDTTTSYTVSLSPSGVTPTEDLTVGYGTTAGTATAGVDYTAASGTLTFTASDAGDKTITVATIEDTLDESGETFTLSIRNPQGGGGPAASLSSTAKSVITTIGDDDATPTAITLSVDPDSLDEGDSATEVTVTATLDGDSTLTSATEVTVSLGGTAGSSDYGVSALASVTIPAGQASGSGTLTVTPTDDAVVEGDETITIAGSAKGFTVTGATLTLEDDDTAELSISGPSANVAEGSKASYTVTLSGAVAEQVKVAWSASLGTAEAADFSPASGSVTFAAGSAAGATKSFDVAVADDDLSEGTETFTVALGAITSDVSSEVSVKSGSGSVATTIGESDPITISLSGPSDVDEGDTTTSYTVSLSPSGVTPTADLTVAYATSDGSATAGDDYTSKSGKLTFTASDTADKTVTVATVEDTLDESGETFTFAISNPQGGGGPAASLSSTAKSVTTSIADDDGTPSSITLSVDPASVEEGDSATGVTVTATLDGNSTLTSAKTVTISLGGTAGASDYGASALASVTIAAGEESGSGTLTVTPTDDAVVEGDETIVVSGAVSGFTVSDATITLEDDDTAELSISGPSANVAEGSKASYTVTLSRAVAKQVKVAWSASLGTAEAADFSPASGSVTFAAGSAAGATKSFDVAVADDDLSEGTETFTVALGAITSDVSSEVSVKSGSGSVATTIAESDPITISLSGPSSVAEGDTTTNYTVSLSPSDVTPTADLTVDYATAAGTATAGDDYTTKSGTLTFTQSDAGDKTVTVATVEDSLDESGETFTLAISNPKGGGGPAASLSSTAKSVITTIGDDDATPSSITLSVDPDSLDEGDSATDVTVTATLDGDSTRTSAKTVTISLGGTAGSSDYGVSSLASVSIPAGEESGSGTLTVTPTDDAVVEGDETIVVSGAVSGFTVSDATITLEDDDTAELSISGPSSNVAEGSKASYTVTLSRAVAKQVKVAWSATLGTAEAADFSPASGSVTFAAGSAAGATKSFDVAVADDDLSEGTETFTVALGAITSDVSSEVSVKSGSGSAATTIAESDPITISLSGPTTVDEGDTTTSYTVSLSPSDVTPTADLTVDYATAAGTATAGDDYTTKSGTLTFTASDTADKTITVATIEDSLDESGETFTFAISDPKGGGGPTPSLSSTAKSVTTTITDDDDAPTGITLSVDPDSLDEGDSATGATVTATLDGDSTLTSATKVTISLGGTAGASDYGASALASVTIPAGQASGSGTLTVTPTDDAVVEGDETITVDGSVTGFTVGGASITLEDDDEAELSISGPSGNVAEGSNAGFTVTLSATVAKQVEVAWSATLGTAEAADFSPASGSVTFPAGSAADATRTFSAAVTEDKLSEGTETFTVTLGTITSDVSSRVSVKSGSGSVTTTIAESDPITISLSGPSSVAEGDTTTNYTVSLSPSDVTPTADLTVDYATAAGTATAGDDYTTKSGKLTFTASDTADKTITVATVEDTLDEAGETFTLAISNPQGGGGPAASLKSTAKSVTTTIGDDDATPSSITLSVDPDSLGEGDSATDVTVTATLDGSSTLATATTVTISLGGTAGSSDYGVSSLASVSIPAGQASGSGTLRVTPTDDAVVEGDETITVSGSATGLTVSGATITLEDDDTAELSISGPSSNVAEGTKASHTVTLSKAVAKQVKVAWSVTLGTAEAADFSPASGTVTFSAGSAAGATKSFDVAVADDDLSEGTETFTVALGTITSDVSSEVSVKSGSGSVTTTIAESDPITISLSGPSSVAEGDTTTNYTVSLSPSDVIPTADLTVDYATAAGTATAGDDYTTKSGTLTFTASDTADKTITVATVEDSLDESGETFTLVISDPKGGGGPAASLSSTAKSVTTTIGDDDATPSSITLSVDPDSLGEGDSATGVAVKATLDGGSTLTSATSVTVSLGGTAGSSDYGVSSLASVSIPAGEASGSGTLTATPTDDAVVEGDETIVVDGSVTGLTVSDATITLEDDDTAELSISGPSANVAEGTKASYTVTLSGAVAKQVKVAWSATLGTAEAADFSPASGSVTFAAGSAAGATQSFDVAVADDDLSEGTETFTVKLGTITSDISSALSVKSGSGSATTTIAASDPITVSLSGPSTVTEGDTTTSYTVSLSPSGVAPTADLTVDYGTSDGSAAAGDDYTSKSGTLKFTASDTAGKTVTVSTVEDTLDESGETFTLVISDPKGGGGPAASLKSTAKSVTTTIADDDGTPSSITLSVDPDSLDEDDSATGVTVTATLDGDSTLTSATRVTISLGGTAGSSDYGVSSLASVTIPAGEASGSGTLTVTPTDDAVVEGDETIVVSGSVSGFTVTGATITLEDDDTAELSISGPSSNVAEGSDASYTVTLSKAVAKQVKVAWSATLGTAEAADFSPASGTATFAAGSAAGATQSFDVAVADDDLSEGTETFTVTLGTITSDISSEVSVKSGSGSVTTTIAESDPITISLSGPSSVTEGDTTTNYTVSLSPSDVTPTADLTVDYATAAGTATAGDDYTSKSGTLTFTASDTADKTFTVATLEDTMDEAGETFTLAISNPEGGGGPAASLKSTAKSVTTTIDDDDDTPESVTLTVAPNSISEQDSATEVSVAADLNGDSTLTSDTVVTISLGGTAGSSDYTVTSALTNVTISAGDTSGSGTLTITPTKDAKVEGDETITVGGSAAGLTVSGATITLRDHDSKRKQSTAELSISGPSANVVEGSNAGFTVTLSASVAKQVKVAWSATLGTAEAADFSPASGTVTFAADSAAGATQSFNVAIADDDLSEGTETFTVTLGTITSDLSSQVSVKSGSGSATTTIAASDPITISLTGPSDVDEGDTTTSYTVSLSPSGVTPTADLTVAYGTSNGSATAGADYTSKSGTLTFTSSDTADKTFTVATLEDTLDEAGETFTLAISDPKGGGGPAASLKSTAKSVTTTIDDDDATPTAITLSVDPDSLDEGDSATDVTVTATLDGDSTLTSATTVTISLGGTAVSSDYGVSSLASVTIPAGQSSGSGTLTVTPKDDAVVEGDETIVVSGSVTGFTVSGATITLEDDDTADLSISGPSSNVAEGNSATYTVTLSKAVAKQVKVAWSATDGTASSSDYTATPSAITFAAGSAAGATRTFTVAVPDDDLSEGTETFTVKLGKITSGISSRVSLKSGSGSTTTTIAASDPITISVSGPSTVAEGDTTGNFTVSLSPSGVTPTADLTVDYATADGTAAVGDDYTSKSGTLTFTGTDAADQTVKVATIEDNLDEPEETFTFAISSPQGGGGPAASLSSTAKSVTTTITDDDGTPTSITLSVDADSVEESDSATDITVTATLDGDSTLTSATTVTISLGGSAGSSDYTASALASVQISAGQASGTGTLRVTPTNDTVVEGDETITVGGSASGFTVTAASITISDDDTAELQISGPAASVAEGSSATNTVTLSNAVAKQVKVAWSATAGTASSSDFAPASGSVTFAAGSAAGSSETFTVTAIDDELSEGAETFSVALGTVRGDLASRVSVKSGAGSVTTTIAESDPITISLSGPSTVAEGDTTGDYTVSLSPLGVTPTDELTVEYATSDGTAAAGEDYTAASGTVRFTASDTAPKTVTVATIEDALEEPDEDFAFAISSPQGGGGPTPELSGAASVTTTITDDDGVPIEIVLSPKPERPDPPRSDPPLVVLSVSPDRLSEDDPPVVVTVTAAFSGDYEPAGDVVVELALAGSAVASGTVTASRAATPIVDYTAVLAEVVIPAGERSGSATITIAPVSDGVLEDDETIVVEGNTGNGLSVTPASITLSDFSADPEDEEDPDPEEEGDPGLVVLSVSPDRLSEDDPPVVVTVTAAFSGDYEPVGDVVVEIALAGSAAPGVDYTAVLAEVVIPAGERSGSATITIAPVSDGVLEDDETIVVEGDTGNGLSVTSTSITLADYSTDPEDDEDPDPEDEEDPDPEEEGDPGLVVLSVSPDRLSEDDPPVVVTVTAAFSGDYEPVGDVVVEIALAGSAAPGVDYTADLVEVVIPAGERSGSATITIAPVSDGVLEDDETIVVEGETGNGLSVTPASITLSDYSADPEDEDNPDPEDDPDPDPEEDPESEDDPDPDPEEDPESEEEPEPKPEDDPDSEDDPEAAQEEVPEPEEESEPSAEPEPAPVANETETVTDGAVPESTGDTPPTPTTQTTSQPVTPTVDSPAPIFVIPLLLLLLLLLLAIEIWRRTRRRRKESAGRPEDAS